MRPVGQIEEASRAAAFADFLFLNGIENEVERDDDGVYNVWVCDEEAFETAAEMLRAFLESPDDPKYRDLEARARKRALELEREREHEGRSPVTFESRDTVDARRFGLGPLTGTLIAVSAVVFVLSRFGRDLQSIMPLFIKEFEVLPTGYRWYPGTGLAEVRSGQVWRLVTPIFIHFGILHVLFNMLWLRQLGSAIEHISGRAFLLVFVVLTAAASNFGQYLITGSPAFGGMSGIVFGLFGFVWMKTKFDFMSGYAIDQQSVILMVGWFFICFTGIFPIANTAHTVGLAFGLVCGYVSARGWMRRG